MVHLFEDDMRFQPLWLEWNHWPLLTWLAGALTQAPRCLIIAAVNTGPRSGDAGT